MTDEEKVFCAYEEELCALWKTCKGLLMGVCHILCWLGVGLKGPDFFVLKSDAFVHGLE
jgi:hypothetical protein